MGRIAFLAFPLQNSKLSDISTFNRCFSHCELGELPDSGPSWTKLRNAPLVQWKQSRVRKIVQEKLKVRHDLAALFLFKDVWKGRKPPPDSLTQSLKQPLIPVHVRHYHVEAGCTVMCRINLGRHECPSDQSSMREKKKMELKTLA